MLNFRGVISFIPPGFVFLYCALNREVQLVMKLFYVYYLKIYESYRDLFQSNFQVKKLQVILVNCPLLMETQIFGVRLGTFNKTINKSKSTNHISYSLSRRLATYTYYPFSII